MHFELPKLPYDMDELAPYISQETLEYHYGKHHQTYVNNLNNLIQDSDLENASLEEIIMQQTGAIFNNAAQVWNHTFYWNCLCPNAAEIPNDEVLNLLIKNFGNFNKFKDQFTKTAITTFGSGWAWLVKNSDNSLEIISTSNADTPMLHGKIALLTCDVWEHAYYIDYRNARPKYLDAFWKLVNWKFVQQNLQC